MKKAIVCLIALAFVVSFASMAMAEEKAPPKKSHEKEVAGKIAAIDVEKMTLSVKPAEGDAVELVANEKTKVTKADKEAKLADLKADDEVTVKYHAVKKHGNVALEIAAK